MIKKIQKKQVLEKELKKQKNKTKIKIKSR